MIMDPVYEGKSMVAVRLVAVARSGRTATSLRALVGSR